MKRILPVFVLSVIVMFFSVLSYAQNQSTKKVYVVFLNDAQGNSFVLQDAQASDFNGIKCVKGKHVGPGWAVHRTIYVPVDRISEIIEEDSLDQYKADISNLKK